MNKEGRSQRIQRDLETRILKLEEQARFTLDILEMASNLGDFQAHVNKLEDPAAILRETIERVQNLVPFQGAAFFLVDEASQDFSIALCDPPDQREYVAREINTLIETGIFPLAVRENRPIIVYSSDMNHRLVLHVLATNSRTRGMFVGLTNRRERGISGIILSLLSIILKNCANAIESFELYRLFREREGRFRHLLDDLPICAFSMSPNGRVLYANRAFEGLFGNAPPEEDRSLPLDGLLTEESRDALAAFLKEPSQGDGLNLTARKPSGEEIPFRLLIVPNRRQGEIVTLICQALTGHEMDKPA